MKIDVREIPAVTAAFELRPGPHYLIVATGLNQEGLHWMGQAFKTKGINAIVVSHTDVTVYELENREP